ncbi:unnamed protein product [Ectocarpus sp. 12 AP-2014]
MTKTVVIIAILVVAGAVIFVSTKSRAENKDGNSPNAPSNPLRFANGEEVAVTANVIIGDLHAEAAEALPSDLQPNTESLLLTDEEEAELFSILNSGSMGALGAPGGTRALGTSSCGSAPSPPLGVSRMAMAISQRVMAKAKVDNLKHSVESLESKLKRANKWNRPVVKRSLDKARIDLKKAIGIHKDLDTKVKRAEAAAEKKKKDELEKARKKAQQEQVAMTRSITLAWGRDGLARPQKLKKQESEYQSLLKRQRSTIDSLKKKIGKTSRFKRGNNLYAKLKAEKEKLKHTEERAKHIGKMLTAWKEQKARDEAEKKRVAAEKAAKLAEKRAREEKARAEKALAESKARAVAQKAKLEKEEAERKRAILEAKRRAEAERRLALEKQRRAERAAAAAAARRRLAEAQAKIKAEALAKKAAELEHKQRILLKKLAREKAAKAEQEKKDKLKAKLKLEALRAAEKAAKEEAERARLAKETARLVAKERERKRRVMEEEKRREQVRRANLEKLRRDTEEAKRLEKEAAEKQARERAKKDAQMKAEAEERARAQKQVEDQAAAAEKRQLELERKDAAKKARAKVVLEHTEADVVAKTASASEKGLKGIKAVHRVQQVMAESKAEENAAKLKRIEAGVKRITGITDASGFMTQLPRLDKKVLSNLVQFYKDEDVPEDGYVFVSSILKDKISRENSTDPEVQAWNKIEKVTGLLRHEFSLRVLANDPDLDLEEVDKLQRHLHTVPKMKRVSEELEDLVSYKKMLNVAEDLDLDMDGPMALANADYEAIGKEGLGKLIQVFETYPRMKKHPAFSKALAKMVDARESKKETVVKGGGKMKTVKQAQNIMNQHKAKEAEELHKRAEKGFERITGIKSGPDAFVQIRQLDKEVIAELISFYKDDLKLPASGYLALSELLKQKIERENSRQPVDLAWNKIEEMTGLQRQPDILRAIAEKDDLDASVLEELQAYLETVPEMKLMAGDLSFLIPMKIVKAVAEELDVELDMKSRQPFANVDFEAVGKVGLDRLIEVFDSRPRMKDHRMLSDAYQKMVVTRQNIEARLIAQAEALEEERLRKQNEELVALEKIRAAEAEKKLQEAAEKLAQEKLRLEREAAQLAQVAAAETERLLAKQQAELVAIESEIEKEKKAVVEQIAVDVQQVEQELSDELQEKLVDAEAAAEQKVEDAKQEQAEVQEQKRIEADEALESIKAEISEAHAEGSNQEIISALNDNLREEAETRQVEMQETEQAFAAEQAAVVKEAEMVKQELVQQFQVKLEEEKTQAEQKLEESVEQVESQKQELVEMQQEVHELEKQELEIEVTIQTDTLDEVHRAVEHQQEIVATTDADDMSIRKNQPHPRASKRGRVAVSKTKHADGSSAISMSVPSDLAPGEVDDISIFVSKEDGETLAMYRAAYKKIARDKSLANLSLEDKKALASGGAVFKQIREQYVRQRKGKVLRRSQSLASS